MGMQRGIKETNRERDGGREGGDLEGKTQAWGEMGDLISRDFTLGQRLLCPCTFLLTPTCPLPKNNGKKRPSA